MGYSFTIYAILLSVRSSGLKVARGADINITKIPEASLLFQTGFPRLWF